MPLSQAQFDRLESMLTDMEPELKKLNFTSRKFVEETQERLNVYKLDMFFSPKQDAWLVSLYTEITLREPPAVGDFEP
jgi:hypothetical protein